MSPHAAGRAKTWMFPSGVTGGDCIYWLSTRFPQPALSNDLRQVCLLTGKVVIWIRFTSHKDQGLPSVVICGAVIIESGPFWCSWILLTDRGEQREADTDLERLVAVLGMLAGNHSKGQKPE